MPAFLLRTYVSARVALDASCRRRQRRPSERGEGLVSAALVVLIFAFLAALMWAVFKDVFTGAATKTKSQVDLIGQ